jgi:hypothetical protein
MKNSLKINWINMLWFAALGAAVGVLLSLNIAAFSVLLGVTYPLKFSTVATNLTFLITALGAGYGAYKN